jgi:hypothetical protein
MVKEIQLFHNELEKLLGKKVDLKINDNRTVMLSIKWNPYGPRISMHRMFLEAPKNIMEELAFYIKTKQSKLPPSTKSYIDINLKKIDYTHQLDANKLVSKGLIYDLQEIYNRLNKLYFNEKLDLAITWFGSSTHQQRSRISLGLYTDSLKLIKIHRLLDHRTIPEYVISFVVYHEMLHNVLPPYIDETGLRRIHSKEFKKEERVFHDYERAQQWLIQHRHSIFRGVLNGRS